MRSRLQGLVRVAFPQLVGQNLHVEVTFDGEFDAQGKASGAVGFRAYPPAYLQGAPAVRSRSDEFLEGGGAVVDGYFASVHFRGRHIHSREMDALTKVVEDHWRTRSGQRDVSDLVRIMWLVTTETKDSRDRRLCYLLVFEPISGGLESLQSRVCE